MDEEHREPHLARAFGGSRVVAPEEAVVLSEGWVVGFLDRIWERDAAAARDRDERREPTRGSWYVLVVIFDDSITQSLAG